MMNNINWRAISIVFMLGVIVGLVLILAVFGKHTDMYSESFNETKFCEDNDYEYVWRGLLGKFEGCYRIRDSVMKQRQAYKSELVMKILWRYDDNT